ncbi:MAG: hypothetical protein ABIU29_08000, partial [Chthoniobacterales bacterium]
PALLDLAALFLGSTALLIPSRANGETVAFRAGVLDRQIHLSFSEERAIFSPAGDEIGGFTEKYH